MEWLTWFGDFQELTLVAEDTCLPRINNAIIDAALLGIDRTIENQGTKGNTW